jgi:hypothetical protein
MRRREFIGLVAGSAAGWPHRRGMTMDLRQPIFDVARSGRSRLRQRGTRPDGRPGKSTLRFGERMQSPGRSLSRLSADSRDGMSHPQRPSVSLRPDRTGISPVGRRRQRIDRILRCRPSQNPAPERERTVTAAIGSSLSRSIVAELGDDCDAAAQLAAAIFDRPGGTIDPASLPAMSRATLARVAAAARSLFRCDGFFRRASC